MTHLPLLLLVVANAVVLSLGCIVIHLVVRAARRTGDRDLRYLSAGFGCITASLLVGGVIHLVVGDVRYGAAVQALFTSMGFALVLYAFWLRHRPDDRSVRATTRNDR